MTHLYGVIGHPIAHSFSPAMHTAAFEALRLDALYTSVDVPPRFLRPVLRALTLCGVEGLNVTVPLKERVVPLLDHIDSSAEAIGAVNTIVIRHRRTMGYNTDGVGFRRALTELGWPARPASAILLGAGGAARAVAWELGGVRGSRLTIANRHPERAHGLVRWLRRHRPGVHATAVPLSRVRLQEATLLVNATTLGMRDTDAPPVNVEALHRRLTVYDVVYHRDTPLVRAARRRGCVAANGVSMLLYQGAESLRLWLRREPPVEIMRKALVSALSTQHTAYSNRSESTD